MVFFARRQCFRPPRRRLSHFISESTLVTTNTLIMHFISSLGCSRRFSSRSPATATSAGIRLELRLLLQEFIHFRLLLIINVRINADSITEVFDASPAHIFLVWALPALSNSGPRARCVPGSLHDDVLLEKGVCGLCGGRQRLDGGFVVAVGGGSPFLGTGNWAGEAHA